MGKFDITTATLGELLDDERVVAIFEKVAPGLASNPMLKMAKGMSVTQAMGMAGSLINQEQVDQIKTEVEELD